MEDTKDILNEIITDIENKNKIVYITAIYGDYELSCKNFINQIKV